MAMFTWCAFVTGRPGRGCLVKMELRGNKAVKTKWAMNSEMIIEAALSFDAAGFYVNGNRDTSLSSRALTGWPQQHETSECASMLLVI